jgi:hypothetical protein
MQYAILDGQRSEAVARKRGSCPICGADMVAKCGPRMLHHWAHASRQNCDPWWENETPWHREWKARFPEDRRELCRIAPDGEVHRADVITASGIVVEIQNSPMSDAERLSREAFYKNMIWIVNGAKFRDQFYILHALPDPSSDVARDVVWFKARADEQGTSYGMFWRPSENPDRLAGLTRMVLLRTMRDIEQAVNDAYSGHHQYDWKRPRAGWLESSCPVFIDFGEEWVWQLGKYGASSLPCARAVAKAKLVHDAMTEPHATAIASRFYPIPRS